MKAVYIIRNLINNKCYIGQTKNYKKRIHDHQTVNNNPNSPLYNHPLYQDMRLYGIENFQFDILKECSTQEELYYYEELYINQYDTIIDHNKGYNLNYGGEHGKHSQLTKLRLPLFQTGEDNISFNKTGAGAYASKKIINYTTGVIYDSLRECALQEYGDIKYVKSISSVCDPYSNKFTYNNNIYYLLDDNNNPILKQTKPIEMRGKVSVREKFTNKIFDSIQSAATYFDVSTGFIRDRIYNRIKHDKFKDKYCFEIYS